MPNLAKMKALLEDAKAAYKAKFTPDFYHASPSNNIKAFDPTHAPSENGVSLYAGDDKANATFITKDPRFANSMLPAGNAMGYKPGSTVYPVSANLGKHFDYETPEGLSTIKNYLAKKSPMPEGEHVTENDIRQWVRDRSSSHNELKEGSWAAIEHPEFQRHLQDEGYDSFAMQEAGRKNIGIYEPHNIRGKFAEYDPAEEFNPDFMKSEGGTIEHHIKGGKVGAALGALDSLAPKNTVTGYKLFRTDPKKPGELFPLFVNRNRSVPIGEWVPAEAGPLNELGRVKSSIGSNGMAYRPGWHAGDVPAATHIGGKSGPETKVVDYRKPEEVWAQVEMPNDVDWQSVANANAKISKSGQPIAKTAEITDQIPFGGHYRYKTNPNMQGNWLIGGQMKVNKVLTDEEVQAINEAAGTADLPRFTKFDKPMGTPEEGMAAGGEVLKKILKFAEDVPFIHYSNHPALNRLEPSMYGQGIKGQEAARLNAAPDIKDRSYFYVNKGEQTMRPEQGLGNQKYQGTASNVYNAAEDPEGFHAIAKSRALDPYMMSFGREMVDPAVKATELERLIKGAGYNGYHTGDVGLMFHPTPVSKID